MKVHNFGIECAFPSKDEMAVRKAIQAHPLYHNRVGGVITCVPVVFYSFTEDSHFAQNNHRSLEQPPNPDNGAPHSHFAINWQKAMCYIPVLSTPVAA